MLVTLPPRIETDRVRLTGDIEQRGSRSGLSAPVTVIFGLAFVVAGLWIGLVGTRVIAVRESSVHAPMWILTVLGASQAIMGALLWRMAWRQVAADRRREAAASARPDEPALADYPWDPSGFEVPRWHGVARFLGGAAFFTLFLSIFNYWAFVMGSVWWVKVVTGLFDLLTIALWVQAAMHVGRALKFHGTRLSFDRFPYPRTMPVVVHWRPAIGIRTARRGSFTLRCVEEWFETTGSGTNSTRSLVHDQWWAETLGFDAAYDFEPGEDVTLGFDLPAGARSTSLAADKPLFWELEVKLSLPGLDFVETYLVPVY